MAIGISPRQAGLARGRFPLERGLEDHDALCARRARRRCQPLGSGFYASVALLALVCALFAPRWARAEADQPNGLQAAMALQQAVVEAVARCEESVVAVARVKKDAPQDIPAELPLLNPMRGRSLEPTDPDFIPNDFAAGVVIDADGLILTNYHVLGELEDSDYYVWSRHRPFQAEVVAADPWYDLAVLKVEAADLTEIPFGDAKQVKKGQIVIALGNPHAIARDGEASASWGIVSNLLRRAPRVPDGSSDPLGRETVHHYGTMIQTDARLHFGFSGGALLNLQGEMIGLTTSYAALAGYEKAAGFAIPVNEKFRRVVETLKQGRKPEYGFLGVAPKALSASLRQQGHHGAQIERVLAATPASRAELQSGDVISRIDGEAIYDDGDLIRVVSSLPPEAEPQFTVVRGDLQRNRAESLDQPVRLSKKHLSLERPQYGTAPQRSWRGMQVDYATAVANFEEIVRRLDPRGCVRVDQVDRDSPAWEAGLRPGAIVSHVGSERVATPDQFYEAVAGREGKVRLRLLTSPDDTAVRTVSP